MKRIVRLSSALLAALLLCSACGDKTSIHANYAPAVKWEEAVAAQTAARSTNTALIMMR